MLQYRGDSKELHKALVGIKSTFLELPEKEIDQLGQDYLQDLQDVFNDYQETYEGTELPVITEQEFLVPIGKVDGVLVNFHGIIDEVYDDGDLGEHKTFSFKPDNAIMNMNLQSMLYAKAREKMGMKLPEKIRWDYIHSKPADKPLWLEKSGRFSEASNSKITHLSWLRACEERGIDDESIINKAEQYRHNISNFFFRHETLVLPQMVETAWNNFKLLAKDIITRGPTNQMMNIGRDCSWCNFRSICYAEFTGADVEYVKSKDYVHKEK